MANMKSVDEVIDAEISGSPICESVKQIADVLFESKFNNDDDADADADADASLEQNDTDEEGKELDKWLRKKEPVRVPTKAWNKY
jgi:hypothetical protein